MNSGIKVVTKRKGRILGATVGGVLLGPLGAAGGALLGTRTEIQVVDEGAARRAQQEADAQPFSWVVLVVFVVIVLGIIAVLGLLAG